jgi:hypothetical protein
VIDPSDLDVTANTIVRKLIREAVALLGRELVATLRGRQAMNRRTSEIHPDADARRDSEIRIDAYENAIGDLVRLGGDVDRIARAVLKFIREEADDARRAPAEDLVGSVRPNDSGAPEP